MIVTDLFFGIVRLAALPIRPFTRNITVGFDIDNTLCDTVTVLDKHYGPRPKGTYYHPNVTENTFRENPELFLEAKAYKSTRFILKLIAAAANICYITSRPKEAQEATLTWLKENRMPKGTIHFDISDKAAFASGLGCNLVFEDCPTEIQQYDVAGIPVIVPLQDYNVQFATNHRCIALK